jgi:hypothetical protein
VVGIALAFSLILQGPQAGRGAAGVVVAGQIQTAAGVPATAVRVSAIPAPPPGVRPEDGIQYYIAPAPVRVALTDEQGRYRLTNMPPGRYLIAAGLIGLATYYPGVTDALLGGVVTVTADMPVDASFKLVTPIGGRVSGRVTPPPAAGLREIAVLSGVSLSEVSEMCRRFPSARTDRLPSAASRPAAIW